MPFAFHPRGDVFEQWEWRQGPKIRAVFKRTLPDRLGNPLASVRGGCLVRAPSRSPTPRRAGAEAPHEGQRAALPHEAGGAVQAAAVPGPPRRPLRLRCGAGPGGRGAGGAQWQGGGHFSPKEFGAQGDDTCVVALSGGPCPIQTLQSLTDLLRPETTPPLPSEVTRCAVLLQTLVVDTGAQHPPLEASHRQT